MTCLNPSLLKSEQQVSAARREVLLKEWLTDELGYDEETWDELKAAMKESRRTSRNPFRD
jgi:hypothetical protein